MNYPNGEDARLGDKVRLWPGVEGIIVCALDADEYSVDYPKAEWSYLRSGVLVLSPQAGLIHYLAPETTMTLLSRATKLA